MESIKIARDNTLLGDVHHWKKMPYQLPSATVEFQNKYSLAHFPGKLGLFYVNSLNFFPI